MTYLKECLFRAVAVVLWGCPMRLSVLVVILASVAGAIESSLLAQELPQATAACDVTTPNGVTAGASEPQPGSYGNALLSVGPFGLWPDGTVIFKPGGPGFVTGDGALGMKFGWTRAVRGKLKVTGHRLDGVAGPLRLEASDGYGDIGFQASYLIFPTPGCWEVNAQVGEREDSKITFVTKIVKIGEGPTWRRNVPPRTIEDACDGPAGRRSTASIFFFLGSNPCFQRTA